MGGTVSVAAVARAAVFERIRTGAVRVVTHSHHLLLWHRLAQAGQRPVLSHTDSARGGTDSLRGLLGGQPDHHAQHKYLSLFLGERVEQPTHLVGELDAKHTLFRAVRGLDRVRHVRDRFGTVPRCGAVRVDYFV
jgi:hypothetical protein